jgi:alkyldihydroxyacetonephosphate synthase
VARLYDPIDSVLLGQSSDSKKAPKHRSAAVGHWFGIAARQALRKPRWLQRTIEALEGNVLGGATLILIFEGEADEADQDAARAELICSRHAARSLGEGPARRWLSHRYGVSFRQSSSFRLGAFTDTMEIAAPWSKLEAVYESVRRELSEHALVMAHLSHAYPDGCSIYFTFSGQGASAGHARERYEAAWRAGLGAALSAGANLSHHHGVGRSKAARLAAELGQGTELLTRLRAAWDPSAMFNQGALEADEAFAAASAPSVRPDFALDEISQLLEVDARQSLAAVEAVLGRANLTLGLGDEAPWSSSVADWIALGFPSAPDPWSDPVRSRVAGFEARVDGVQARVRATPRRATGPDLLALFAGAHGRVGVIERAQLASRKRGVSAARSESFHWDRDPAITVAEERAFELAAQALRGNVAAPPKAFSMRDLSATDQGGGSQ